MIGLAFEIVDSRQQAKNKDSDQAKLFLKYKAVDPTFMDIFHYAFNHCGILTGKCNLFH